VAIVTVSRSRRRPTKLPRVGRPIFFPTVVLDSIREIMRGVSFIVILGVGFWFPHRLSEGAGTGYDPRVITFGESRAQIKSLPITARPNRPLHVYGNTVRRRHHRGDTSVPVAGHTRPAR
jgi:hypothetical protein